LVYCVEGIFFDAVSLLVDLRYFRLFIPICTSFPLWYNVSFALRPSSSTIQTYLGENVVKEKEYLSAMAKAESVRTEAQARVVCMIRAETSLLHEFRGKVGRNVALDMFHAHVSRRTSDGAVINTDM